MSAPFISYLTFNRLGLTARNLQALLKNHEDFEMHIVDSNSTDGTWEYLQTINDPRIKSKTRMPHNYGPIYGVNFNLAKRKPDQFFITVDSDVLIKTKGWIKCFMDVFNTYDDVGLLGVPKGGPYPRYIPEVIPMTKNNVSYLKLKNANINVPLDFVPGCVQCLRPELIDVIGYWNEECYYGDAEISARITHYTKFSAGLIETIEIDQQQRFPCTECSLSSGCNLLKAGKNCFDEHVMRYKNSIFAHTFRWKFIKYFEELKNGNRTVYSASIHDPESIRKHVYNLAWAQENFNFYLVHTN